MYLSSESIMVQRYDLSGKAERKSGRPETGAAAFWFGEDSP
jgi:hypothetical protein